MDLHNLRWPRAVALAFGLAVSMLAQADYTLTCGSVGGRHNTCRLSEPGYVTIARQISGARCEQGRSWDFDRREIWVDHGCEAEFRVERWSYRRDGQPTGSATSASSGSSHDAAVAAAVIAGVAVLGALANNKDHQDDYKYRDPNYYGPRHTS